MSLDTNRPSAPRELLERFEPLDDLKRVLAGLERPEEEFVLLWVNLLHSSWLNYVEGRDYVDRWLVTVGEALVAAAGPGRMYASSDQYWVLFTPDEMEHAVAARDALTKPYPLNGRTYGVLATGTGLQLSETLEAATTDPFYRKIILDLRTREVPAATTPEAIQIPTPSYVGRAWCRRLFARRRG